MKDKIQQLMVEYKKEYNKEVPMNILMHNEATIVKLLEKELNNKEVTNMYEFKLNEKERDMVLYAISKMDVDKNSDYEEFKELFLKIKDFESNK